KEIALDIKLHQSVANTLPQYMLPSHYEYIDSFPLTPNGKIDFKNLPKVETLSNTYVKPVSELEIKLCELWEEVLGIEKIGVTDDFFRIGGNSILAIRASHMIGMILDCDITVAELFKSKTIRELSKKIILESNSLNAIEWNIEIH
ncbi:phosphopantetheine-binding protein, partial [Croceitalea sp. MTPC5]|uniref:phosphopantetheine-binding protein n=1 Tax=Croceitalea sp. MTPC5 TaxID=3056565 RepID=UPI0030D53D08